MIRLICWFSSIFCLAQTSVNGGRKRRRRGRSNWDTEKVLEKCREWFFNKPFGLFIMMALHIASLNPLPMSQTTDNHFSVGGAFYSRGRAEKGKKENKTTTKRVRIISLNSTLNVLWNDSQLPCLAVALSPFFCPPRFCFFRKTSRRHKKFAQFRSIEILNEQQAIMLEYENLFISFWLFPN